MATKTKETTKRDRDGQHAKPAAAATNRIAELVPSLPKAESVKSKIELMELNPLEIVTAQIIIVGASPLIVHRFSEKAQREIEQKQQGKEKLGRAKRNPQAEFEDSMHRMPNGAPGIRTIAFKQAACRAAKGTKLSMQGAYGAFHMVNELVEIQGPKPKMCTHCVRIGPGIADIRYRAEFWPWSVLLTIEYNKRAISMVQLCNLFTVAGFATGVGELRPEKKGHSNGRFKVGTRAEAETA